MECKKIKSENECLASNCKYVKTVKREYCRTATRKTLKKKKHSIRRKNRKSK